MTNGAPAPDIAQQLLQMQSMIAASQGSRNAHIFGIIPFEINVGGGLGMQSLSPLAKNMTGLNGIFRAGKPSPIQAAMNAALEDFKKMAQNAGVIYSGEVVNNSVTSGLQPPGSGTGRGYDIA